MVVKQKMIKQNNFLNRIIIISLFNIDQENMLTLRIIILHLHSIIAIESTYLSTTSET